VLVDQDYRTRHDVVTDEYGAIVEWWLEGKPEECGEKPVTVSLCPKRIPLW